MCIYKEHYERILSVFPAVAESAAQDCITIPTSPMTGIIKVKQRGQSVMRLEIGFHYRHGEELLTIRNVFLQYLPSDEVAA